MTRLEHLHECMKPQFIWHGDTGLKIMQTNELFEGSKDLARMVFVGLADIYGFPSADVQEFLDMEYDSYRNKLQDFRKNWKLVMEHESSDNLELMGMPLRKFNNKVRLCLNAIRWKYKHNPYLKLGSWMEYE